MLTRRIFLLSFLFAVTLIATSPAEAQSVFYVRAGATGSGNGSDWTNAYKTLPATLQRGATYYIADGSYGSYTFDDANSGTTKIFIKKAIESDHGSSVGWQSSYGDGAAEWTFLKVSTDYWELDGQVGQSAGAYNGVAALPNHVPYGFRVFKSTTTEFDGVLVVGHWSTPRVDVTLRHMEAFYTNTPKTPGNWAKGQTTVTVVSTPTLLQYIWSHDAGWNTFYLRSNSAIIEHSVFERNGHAQIAEEFSPNEHSQGCDCGANGGTINWRYNVMRDIVSISNITAATNNDTFLIHGNVFTTTNYWTDEEVAISRGGDANNLTPGDSHGIIGVGSGAESVTVRFYNNTAVDMQHHGLLMAFGATRYLVRDTRNNIFYNVQQLDGDDFVIGGTHDYNWFFNSGTQSETNIQNGAGDPFMNRGGKDYRLALPTLPGASLSSPYNVDANGNARGADGAWDRGAFEYTGELTATPPAPPLNLRIVN